LENKKNTIRLFREKHETRLILNINENVIKIVTSCNIFFFSFLSVFLLLLFYTMFINFNFIAIVASVIIVLILFFIVRVDKKYHYEEIEYLAKTLELTSK